MTATKTKIIHCIHPGCDWEQEVNASSRRKRCPYHVKVQDQAYADAYRKEGETSKYGERVPRTRRHSRGYEAHRKAITERFGIERHLTETDVYPEPSEFRLQARKLG